MFTVTADPHTAAAKTDAPGVVTLISQTQAGTHIVMPVLQLRRRRPGKIRELTQTCTKSQ